MRRCTVHLSERQVEAIQLEVVRLALPFAEVLRRIIDQGLLERQGGSDVLNRPDTGRTVRMPTQRVPDNMATTCTSCGAPIVFAKSTETGKTIPLDVRNHPIYVLVIHDGEARAVRSQAYISHFVTCPQREQHSRREDTTATPKES